jgi:hypothetical protein
MSTFCALEEISAGYISSYSLVLVVLIESLTSAWVKRQKYWAGFEGEFEKLKVDTSGMAVFKSTQGSTWYLTNLAGIGKILLLTFTIVVLPNVDVRTVDYPTGEIRGQIMSASSNHAELVIELTSISKFCSKVQRPPHGILD